MIPRDSYVTSLPLLERAAKHAMFRLITFTVILNLIMSLAFALVSHHFGYRSDQNFLSFESVLEEILVVIILAPLLETTVYQYCLLESVIYITAKLFQRPALLLAVIIPAVAFGFSHSYNFIYLANALFAGVLLNCFYLVAKEKGKHAFLYTVLVHSLYNALVFLIRNAVI